MHDLPNFYVLEEPAPDRPGLLLALHPDGTVKWQPLYDRQPLTTQGETQ